MRLRSPADYPTPDHRPSAPRRTVDAAASDSEFAISLDDDAPPAYVRHLPMLHLARRRARPWRAAFAMVIFISASAAATSCKGRSLDDLFGPKEGDACTTYEGKCTSSSSQIVCVDGRYIARRCSGPRGCTTDEASKSSSCDWEADLAGTACAAAEATEGSCVSNDQAILQCTGGRMTLTGCEGPRKCDEAANKTVVCDASIGTVGERCSWEGAPSCANDGKTVITCTRGAFEKTKECKGPKGCQAFLEGDAWRVECDHSLAEVGDVCSGVGSTCSLDKKSMLLCKDGRFVHEHKCLGELGCHTLKGPACDNSAAEVGDPCQGESTAVCSVDKKARLSCRQGTYVLDRQCSCKVDGDFVRCT